MEHHVDKHYDVADAKLVESTTTETKHISIKASGHYEKVECGVGGEKMYVCKNCGNTYTEKIDAPEAHEYIMTAIPQLQGRHV